MSKNLRIALLLLYVITRLYIWIARPTEFSEIIYSYMPYAHLWAGGTVPYREQWYEYPPATIPLFYLPHLVDSITHPTAFHLNYLQAYRLSLVFVDIGIFALIWKSLQKQRVSNKIFAAAIIYYCLLTAKAHHFLYDTMDITFAGAITLGVVGPVVFTKGKAFVNWLGFWLATALKYVNAPFAVISAWIHRAEWKQHAIASVLAFICIWGVPLALYRSSLSVSLVYHQLRGVQIDSVPAIFIRTADRFTRSEKVIEVYKNYEIAGPLTDQMKKPITFIFVGSLAAFLLGSLWVIYKHPEWNKTRTQHWFTIGYLLIFLLTGKVLSTPFLLWLIPLWASFAFQKDRRQLFFLVFSAIGTAVTMTRVSNMAIGIFPLPLLVGWLRTLTLFGMFIAWLRWTPLELHPEPQPTKKSDHVHRGSR